MNEEKSSQKKFLVISIILLVFGILFFWFGISQSANEKHENDKISASPTAIQTISSANLEPAFVSKVVDGDTIEVKFKDNNNEETTAKVRYIGIDTPETVDPRRPVGCFGKEASDKNKELVEGKEILMEKDITNTDKYDRLLRYIYLVENNQKIFINDVLVKEGFAKSYTYPPDVKYQHIFLASEKDARENSRGLWQKCF